ncbi:MAG: hypothetical protein H0X18_10185 [Geodermatophilaceae bacterium]|nr:hypothetical protein [Geodermatophilaceae bacterium]
MRSFVDEQVQAIQPGRADEQWVGVGGRCLDLQAAAPPGREQLAGHLPV